MPISGDADNARAWRRATPDVHTLSERILLRPDSPCHRLIHDDDGLAFFSVAGREGTPAPNHRADCREVVHAHSREIWSASWQLGDRIVARDPHAFAEALEKRHANRHRG